MENKREELRKELFELRLKLDLTRKERVESDKRVDDIKNKINEVKKEYAREVLRERESEENGKKL